MNEEKVQESDGTAQRGRNPLVVLVGFSLLGAALALLMFGGDVLNRAGAPPNSAQPEPFATSQPAIAPLSARGGVAPGDEAPNFLLEDFDGMPVSLSEFRGRPVILNFWATWCAPCRIEMPELQAVYEKYREDGLVILALDQDEPLALARTFFYDEMGLTFTPLMDHRSLVAAQYGAFFTLPSTYFVDGDGRVAAVHRGTLTRNQIENYLAQIMP
jgi:cytochrome c biogenesis protein CcmG, thiol:disulfide interchange protein DsbE